MSMADETRRASGSEGTEPPGGGRADHDVMREAAMRPVTGPASTDVLAAIGGINLPGNESHPELTAQASGPAHGGDAPGPIQKPEIIPGERDPSTLTQREPGAVSGQFAGADIPADEPRGWLDERTLQERIREGGGT
jgi:hypothetical protein